MAKKGKVSMKVVLKTRKTGWSTAFEGLARVKVQNLVTSLKTDESWPLLKVDPRIPFIRPVL